jgi:hypothetical protein
VDCNLLKKHLETLETNRSSLEGVWDLIRQYVMPFRGNFYDEVTSEASMNWRENRSVYDSTAINANNTLASSLHGAITNPSHQWFELRFQSDELNDNNEAAQWLRDCSRQVFERIRDSNFNLEGNEAYLDLTSFGTAFMSKEVVEASDNTFKDFVFKAVPIAESYFDEDYRGRVHRFFRKMKWTPTQIVSKFGVDKVPQKIVEAHEQGKSKDRVTVVFAVYKRDDIDYIAGVSSPENRPYGYKYFLYETKEQLGEEGGYYTMPIFAMRWRSTSDTMWGNSPAMHALPDILTLNELVELILNSLEKVVDPAIKVAERSLLTDLDLGAAGVNVLRDIGDMEAFESRARFDVAQLNRDQLKQSIQQIFYVDQLALKESPAMTATEVQVRYELMQRLLGPTLGRLESDFLDPLVSSTFADLYRYKMLPEAPTAVGSEANILIEYTSPMARAQRLDNAASMERFLGAVAQIGEVNPQALEKVDWDKSVELMAEYYGVEPKALRSSAEVKAERKRQTGMAERQMEADVRKTESEAIKNAGVAQ